MKQVYEVTVNENGDQYWKQNGKLHRTDGPAIIRANGDQSWWQNDKLHRIDGPAVTYADGSQAWYLNGTQVTEVDVMKTKPSCEGTEVVVDGVKYRLTAI